MKKGLLIILLTLPLLGWAESNNDFGTWAEIGIEKSLSKKWSVGMETEYRAQEKARWSIGVNGEYKINKHLKFGAFYTFQESKKPESKKDHYKNDIEDADHWNGYNIREKFWSPRHRAGLDITGTIKLWKWMRISVRERYQYTHRMARNYDVTKERYDKFLDAETGNPVYQMKDNYPITEANTSEAEDDHVLRSRLKLEYDKKGCALTPFISAETHNNMSQNMILEKVRSCIGVDYKINKSHSVSLSYILTTSIYDDEEPYERIHDKMHAIGIGYNYKF